MKLNIPETARTELLARLEEIGASWLEHQDNSLYSKLWHSSKVDLGPDELIEMFYHCQTMVELAAENEDDEEYVSEAKGAKQVLKQIAKSRA